VLCGPVFAGDDFVCALLLGHGRTAEREATTNTFDASDMALLESLNLFCGDMIRNFRLVGELQQLSVDMVRALISAIEQKDEYTSGHSARVGMFAVLLGREVGLDAAELQMLEWSALLHDIGKIGIRDDVLKKAGRLTDAEFRHIQEHPTRSFDVVCQVPQLAPALDGVLYHHEHWDGGGYPKGLAGEDIPTQARIIQVADIFDALTSTRSYRKPFPWPKALEILRNEAGTTADPGLVACFDRLICRMAQNEPERLHAIMATDRHHQTGSPEDVADEQAAQLVTGGV
jgi:HD-GYP domain-containing protein (c-di-GMP phosphodiesterase class II)